MKSYWRLTLIVTLSLLGAAATPLPAAVRLPAVFSDHMVLRKMAAAPVWGWAEPGERVRVTLGKTNVETVTDPSGHWKLTLDLHEAAAEPIEMIVEGTNRLVIHDVVVGEVWLASGQSNMELPLRKTADAEAEIARSANPLLRQFLVKKVGARTPAEDCQGSWTVAGPETSGDFTAVGYYFGKEFQPARRCAVGIIHSSHGGTFIEPWIPADSFDRLPSFKAADDALRLTTDAYPARRKEFIAQFGAWLKAHDREDEKHPKVAPFADEQASTADWEKMKLPGKAQPADFPASGVYWLRREIDVPAQVAALGFKVMIGPVNGYWQAYWNGRLVDDMPYARLPGKGFGCYFPVPLELIRPGKNTLAIRIYSPTAPLAVLGGAMWAGPIDLNGEWNVKVERAFPELSAEVLHSAPQLDYTQPAMLPGNLYNGMIAPLATYGLSGVLWYQGESNVGRAFEYRTAFTTLIQGWREKWAEPDLPFYFCELTNNYAKQSNPGESAWAELRESQSEALALPHTGQAVTIDVGEAEDLHSRDKKTVGHRLFLIAAAEHYGHVLMGSGPVYESMQVEGGKIRVKFHRETGMLGFNHVPATYPVKTLTGEMAPLVRNSPNSELEGFAICGADHHWVWADARIDENQALVWSDKVPQPVAVRYDWADNPNGNLTNNKGLPAAPFRTDQFRVTTQDKHF